MTIAMFKRRDTDPKADPDATRRGCRKRTDWVQIKPNGFLDFAHGNGPGSYLNDFCFIQIDDMTDAEAESYSPRNSWKDDFDYDVTPQAGGEYSIRIFEKNAGAINQNAIAGVKATRIRNYLQAWGCSNFSLTATDASFTFSLWDAVRSANFWEVPLIGTKINFTLNSYSNATGIGNITATAIAGQWGELSNEKISEQITRRIIERGGTIISQVYPNFVFEIERSDIVTKFRQDVKSRMEQVYMRHQYGISQADHDAIVAAGGIVTMTRAEYLGKLINKMAAV